MSEPYRKLTFLPQFPSTEMYNYFSGKLHLQDFPYIDDKLENIKPVHIR